MARRYLPFRPNGLLVGQAHRLPGHVPEGAMRWRNGMGAAVSLLFERSAQVLDGKEGSTKDPAAGGRPSTTSAVRAGDYCLDPSL